MKPGLKLRREAGLGATIPRGWRMAWYEPRRRVGVYYPPPLHWMLHMFRELAYRMRVALKAPSMERADIAAIQQADLERQRLADEYASGYLAGWRECFQTCLEAVQQEVARVDEIWGFGDLLTAPNKSDRHN
ncbi:MAG TPA: hypothetical protein VMD78_17115 [Candidatus Baltobacteraceae bacterium]|nr:hypothetical protein [Candidatus Baltobacteraceae bacterium]